MPTGWNSEVWVLERACIDGMPALSEHWVLTWNERRREYAIAQASNFEDARRRIIEAIGAGLTKSAGAPN